MSECIQAIIEDLKVRPVLHCGILSQEHSQWVGVAYIYTIEGGSMELPEQLLATPVSSTGFTLG